MKLLVSVRNDLQVPFEILRFILFAMNTIHRAAARLADPEEQRVPLDCPDLIQYKIPAIKLLRSMPGFEYGLKDGKDIIEYLIANQHAIERIGEYA